MATHAPDLLIDFLQTREAAEDAFASAEGLASWMAERGLVPPGTQPSEADLTRVRHVRAALRTLFGSHGSSDLDERTRATLERVTEEAPLMVRFSAGSLSLQPQAEGIAAGLAQIVSLLYDAYRDGTLARYKTCKKCGWAFYDESKNRSRVWCDMALCGSQIKAASYRARKKSV